MKTPEIHNDTSLTTRLAGAEKKIWELLETVCDPEIPVLSILDLGIVRSVSVNAVENREAIVKITITPTYSGCPAMDMISMQIRMTLLENGYINIIIESVLSPVWTTDWMSAAGKEKLHTYGIAPPHLSDKELSIICPQCSSASTKLLSQFGSTACKALYQCQECLEPFDYFKCH